MVVLKARVDVLEEKVARVAPLEAEVAEWRENWQEIHRVQSEKLTGVRVELNNHVIYLQDHGRMLREHGKTIADLRETQLAQGKAIDDLRETQLEHGKAISDLRTEFGGLRTEFGEFRNEVRRDYAEIARSLVLLIGERGKSPS